MPAYSIDRSRCATPRPPSPPTTAASSSCGRPSTEKPSTTSSATARARSSVRAHGPNARTWSGWVDGAGSRNTSTSGPSTYTHGCTPSARSAPRMPAAVAASRARVWNRSPVARSTPREPFRTTAGGARSKRASGSAVVRRRRPVATSSRMPAGRARRWRRVRWWMSWSRCHNVPSRSDTTSSISSLKRVSTQEGGGGRDAMAGDGGGVDGGDRGRQVEVVVEGGSHLVERGVTRPRRPPRRRGAQAASCAGRPTPTVR